MYIRSLKADFFQSFEELKYSIGNFSLLPSSEENKGCLFSKHTIWLYDKSSERHATVKI